MRERNSLGDLGQGDSWMALFDFLRIDGYSIVRDLET